MTPAPAPPSSFADAEEGVLDELNRIRTVVRGELPARPGPLCGVISVDALHVLQIDTGDLRTSLPRIWAAIEERDLVVLDTPTLHAALLLYCTEVLFLASQAAEVRHADTEPWLERRTALLFPVETGEA